jgi:Domain of unknown function (DUF4920)
MYKRYVPVLLLPVLLLIATFFVSLHVIGQEAVKQQETCADPGEVIKRGAALGNAPVVQFSEALATPRLFSGRTVRIAGIVERNCTEKGCWMELAPKLGSPGVRVTFKDYGFFIPLNSKGMKAIAEGEFAVATMSKEKADHLEAEGARLKRNADGTVNEVSFIASAVELRK